MFKLFRYAVFNVTGGFAVTDFYLSTAPSVPQYMDDGHGHSHSSSSSSSWWWPFGAKGSAMPGYYDEPPELTFREDVSSFVQDNQTGAMLTTGAIVAMGGPWAMAGSALAIFSDTQEGLNLYLRVKDWYEGNSDDDY